MSSRAGEEDDLHLAHHRLAASSVCYTTSKMFVSRKIYSSVLCVVCSLHLSHVYDVLKRPANALECMNVI